MRRVSVFDPFLWAKVLQNPPVLGATACRAAVFACRAALPLSCRACRLKPCRLPAVLPSCAAAFMACRYALPPACRFHGLPPAVSLPLCWVRLPRCRESIAGTFSRCRHALRPAAYNGPAKRPQKSPRAWHGVNLPPPRAYRFYG